MLKFKSLTIKNFMSVGNITQGINFGNDLTLVLGENLDLGANGSRNGTGKTTIVNALSYVLYGNALTKIKLGNLINKTNEKGMVVSAEFSKNGVDYKIERGRKPNVLKLFVGDQELDNDAQGDSRETQKSIEDILGLSHEMFKNVVALNTHTEPFLNMKVADQRDIIEELLGITILSEKATALKDLIKDSKDLIKQENIKISATKESNRRIETQITSLESKRDEWGKSQITDIEGLYTHLEKLNNDVDDIDTEIDSQRKLETYNTTLLKLSGLETQLETLVSNQTLWNNKLKDDTKSLNGAITELSDIDIEVELQSHKDLGEYNTNEVKKSDIKKQIATNDSNIRRANTLIATLNKEIEDLNNHVCHTCGQDLHDDKQNEILESKKSLLNDNTDALERLTNKNIVHNSELDDIVLGDKPSPYYKTLDDALNHKYTLESLGTQLENKSSEKNPYDEQIENLALDINNIEVGDEPLTFYKSLEEALNHKHLLSSLSTQMEKRASEDNPYTDQIESIKSNTLQQIDYDIINDTTMTLEHQQFLLKLLTDKDSFVRKQIISQNLSFLNSKLTYYINKIGLRHVIEFKDDLSVEISDLGKDYDFDNLSRGEKNRVILSLSWAFRDVWENLYSPINLLFVDEVIDSGMDDAGVENSLLILKSMTREQNKSVWLISHKNELISRVNNVMNVIKENGFTSFNIPEE